METRYLEDFLVVAKYLNFGQAAEELFESASVLSKHIATLESDLGVKLFDRTTRSVTMTEYGKALLPYASRIARDTAAYRKHAEEMAEAQRNTLHLLTIPVILHYGIAQKLSVFVAEHPEIELQITETEPHNQEEHFLQGGHDLMLCGAVTDSGLGCVQIAESELVAVFRAGHPFSRSKKVQLDQLRQENFLLHDEATTLYQRCMKAFSTAGYSPKVVYKSQRPELILQFVIQGLGIALMVRRVVEYYALADIVCVDIEPRIPVYVYLAWNGKDELKPAAKLLRDFLAAG